MIKKFAKSIRNLVSVKNEYQNYLQEIHIKKELLAKFLPPNPTIIDCGAHVGIDTRELAKMPGSKVFAFEPVEHIYRELRANTSGYKNIRCYKIALNNFDGRAEMYVSSGDSDGSSSLLKPKEHIIDHPNVLFSEVTEVECLRLNSWCRINNINSVDLLWLDMQGNEMKMLKASQDILKTVSLIHTEVSLRETYEGVETYTEYKEYLKLMGFKVLVEAIPQGYDMGNVIFVRK